MAVTQSQTPGLLTLHKLSQGDLIGCIACNTSYKQFPNVSPQPQPPFPDSGLAAYWFRLLWFKEAVSLPIQSRVPHLGTTLNSTAVQRLGKCQSPFSSVPNPPVCLDHR